MGEDEFPQHWPPLPSHLPTEPPGLAGPSCGPSQARGGPVSQGFPPPPTSQRGPSAADCGPPPLPPAHPCLQLATAARAAGLFKHPGWLTTQPPLPGADTRPRPHSPQRRAPADRQSRRRARSSPSNAARRWTTTPRSPRAPRGTVGSAAAVLRQKHEPLARRRLFLMEGSADLWTRR